MIILIESRDELQLALQRTRQIQAATGLAPDQVRVLIADRLSESELTCCDETRPCPFCKDFILTVDATK